MVTFIPAAISLALTSVIRLEGNLIAQLHPLNSCSLLLLIDSAAEVAHGDKDQNNKQYQSCFN